jgi:ribonuclease P protein component
VPRFKHSAVDRNRLKRRLRELARLRLLPALAGREPADVVIRIAPPAYAAPFAALAADVERLLRQLERVPLPPRRPVAARPRSRTAAPAAPAPPVTPPADRRTEPLADAPDDPGSDAPGTPTPLDPA